MYVCAYMLHVYMNHSINQSLLSILKQRQQVGDSRREPKILRYVCIWHIYEPSYTYELYVLCIYMHVCMPCNMYPYVCMYAPQKLPMKPFLCEKNQRQALTFHIIHIHRVFFLFFQKERMRWSHPIIGIHMRLGVDKNREAQRFPTK